MKKYIYKSSFSIIELIFAVAIFVIFATGSVTSVIQGFDLNRSGIENTIASQYASEGIEAIKSIKNQAFSNLTNTAGTGIIRNGSNVWAMNGSNNALNKYTRVISIGDVQRDINGNIVASGGTLDANSKKITSTVTWNFTTSRPQTLSLITYLTNWRKPIINFGDWTNPNTLAGSLDLTGNQTGLKVQVLGSYAYVIRNISGGVNFIVINISNPATPTQVGSLTTTGTPTNIFVLGNYAYLSANDTNAELKIIDISTPSTPTLTSAFNLPGNSQTNGVFVSGNAVYLARNSSSSDEFYIVNATVKNNPSVTGSLNLSSTTNDVVVIGNYAYLATANTNQQLQVINITTPATPSLAGFVKLGGNAATSIDASGTTAILGSGSTLYVVNISTPTAPTQSGTFSAGGNINDVNLVNSNYAFLATSNTNSQLEVVDITTPATPTLFGIYKAASGNYNGLAYDSTSDRVYAATTITTAELNVISP